MGTLTHPRVLKRCSSFHFEEPTATDSIPPPHVGFCSVPPTPPISRHPVQRFGVYATTAERRVIRGRVAGEEGWEPASIGGWGLGGGLTFSQVASSFSGLSFLKLRESMACGFFDFNFYAFLHKCSVNRILGSSCRPSALCRLLFSSTIEPTWTELRG